MDINEIKENLDSSMLLFHRDEDYVIKIYRHINNMYKFYLNLRFIILGAALGALSFILTNFANTTEPITDFRRILIFLGIGTTIIFYLMDFRTKTLFRETRKVGKKVEEEYIKIKGFYTLMTEIDEKKGFFRKLQMSISHSRIIGFAYLFIFTLFIYLLIISYN